MGTNQPNSFAELKKMQNKMSEIKKMREQLRTAKKNAQQGYFEMTGSLEHCVESLATCCETPEYDFLAKAS